MIDLSILMPAMALCLLAGALVAAFWIATHSHRQRGSYRKHFAIDMPETPDERLEVKPIVLERLEQMKYQITETKNQLENFSVIRSSEYAVLQVSEIELYEVGAAEFDLHRRLKKLTRNYGKALHLAKEEGYVSNEYV